MSASHTRLGSGFVATLVRENLGAVLADEHCTLVLEEALVHAGLARIPAEGPALREFLERHLVGTLSSAVEPSAARSVVAQIIAVLPPELLDQPPPTPSQLPTGRTRDDLEVVVVTASDDAFSRITRRFAPTAVVARQRRLAPARSVLVDPIFVIDAREMPPGRDPIHEIAGRDVVLWGADRWTSDQIEWVLSFARTVTRCPSEVEAEDLTAICGALRMEGTPRVSTG